MSVVVPNGLALASIADGSAIVASDHRNNYSAVQVGVNGLIAMFTNAATKGDLIVSQGGGSFDKLAVGANGKTIIADSSQPLGVKYDNAPGATLAYVEFTANVTANGITEATAVQIVSAGAVTFDGTAVDIEFFCPALATAGAGLSCGINLWDVTTDLGRLFDGTVVAPPAAASFPCGKLIRRLTPSAGSHTYNARIWTTTASNWIAIAGAGGAGTKMPGYIKITKV